MAIDFLNKLDFTSFLSGLGLGSIIGFALKKFVNKLIDRIFDRENIGYDKLTDRYNKLYSPLMHKIMEVAIESSGRMIFKRKLELVIKYILSGNFKSSLDIFESKRLSKSNDYYLSHLSDKFDLNSVKQHIKKYHHLADSRLVELLASAINAEKEKVHYNELEKRIEFIDDRLTPEAYDLINHIRGYNKHLNSKLNPN
ncbi:MAG: hypothetical protein O3B87_03570 [bacterium]|nr:hypothetical protein [bacterium]